MSNEGPNRLPNTGEVASEAYDSTNIFARILRQEIPCQKVYEDEVVLAFHDIHPKAPVHILVIPKGEYINFHDFHEKASASFVAHFYQKISEIIESQQLNERGGYRLISNCGPHGGQEVPHYHVHILGGKLLGGLVQEEI